MSQLSGGSPYSLFIDPTTSSGVTSLASGDGSLTITPSTGAVDATINTTHANTWLTTQLFSGASPVRFLAFPTNSIPYITTLAGSGTLTASSSFTWNGTILSVGSGEMFAGNNPFMYFWGHYTSGPYAGYFVNDSGTTSAAIAASGVGAIFNSGSATVAMGGFLSTSLYCVGGDVYLAGDNLKLRIGTSLSSEIYYDGTDLRINAAAVGSGKLKSATDIEVPDEVYGAGWDGSLEVPTKNALYDKIQTIAGGSPLGSDGQLQYNNGGSFGGTAQGYYDDVNNRFGFGTTTPRINLEISKAANAECGIQLTNTSAAAGSSVYTVIYLSEEATPSTKFGAFFYLNSGYTTSGLFQANRFYMDGAGSGGLWIGSRHASGVVAFYCGGSATTNEAMRISAAGLVGIGSTAPTTKLEVKGTGASLGGVTNVLGEFYDSTARAIDVGGSIVLSGNYLTASPSNTRFAGIKGGKENATDNDYASYMALYTRANGSALQENARINSAGQLYLTQNLVSTMSSAAASVAGSLKILGNSTTYSGLVIISAGASPSPYFSCRGYGGTINSPTNSTTSMELMRNFAGGYNSADASDTGGLAGIKVQAETNFTSSGVNPAYISFWTTATTSAAMTEKWRMNSAGALINKLITSAYIGYDAAGDTTRAMLKIGSAGNIGDAGNIVALCNRTVDGRVQIQCNTSTGGAAGETLVIQFEDDKITNYQCLMLRAGTAAANTCPLQFQSGTSLTTAVAGVVEFTTDDLFFTITTGTARKRFLFADPVGGLTSGRVPFATTNGRLTDDADMTFATDTLTVTKIVGSTSVKAGSVAGFISSDGSTGATGTFTSADAKTITVKDGIITSIV